MMKTEAVPSRQALAAAMLRSAVGYVGISRETDRGQIARFLGLFGLPFAEGDGTPVPFCAAGVGWCACKAWAELMGVAIDPERAVAQLGALLPDVEAHWFVPNPSCGAMQQAALGRYQWIEAATMGADVAVLPGWLALFEFGGNDRHVEIVTADHGDEIETIGFNTCSGGHSGVVARKRRDWSAIWGYIRTW